MPVEKVLGIEVHSKLITDLRGIIREGRQRAVQSARDELVKTYWQVGKRISEEHLSSRAGYKEAIWADLSEELEIDLATLKRSLQFFKTYKSAPRSISLNWSHYKKLITIKNSKKRRWYEKLTQDNLLNRNQLAQAINEENYKNNSNN